MTLSNYSASRCPDKEPTKRILLIDLLRKRGPASLILRDEVIESKCIKAEYVAASVYVGGALYRLISLSVRINECVAWRVRFANCDSPF